jgi:hypothetical protein
MAEKVSSRDVASKMTAITDELVFVPQRIDQKMKASFWIKWNQGPVKSQENISAAAVAQVLGNTVINKRWHIPGFKEWFLNKDEYRQRIEYIGMRALDVMSDILEDETVKPDVRLKAAKTVLELGGKFITKKPEVIVLDKDINSMNQEQLDEFIKANTAALEASKSEG